MDATRPLPASRPIRLRGTLRAGLAGLGPVGRWAMLAFLIALTAAAALGLSIPRSVERDLLESRAQALRRAIDGIVAGGVYPASRDDPVALEALGREVRVHLIGTDATQVKIWAPDGTILFADDETQVGQTFDSPDAVLAALSGQLVWEVPDPAADASDSAAAADGLMEFYVPVPIEGLGTAVFEVYETTTTLNDTVASIRRTIWTALGLGLGGLAVAVAAIVFVSGALLDRKRVAAARLVDQLVHVQEAERRRIVGALHDDIGQPLYRVLYGLQALPTEEPRRTEEAKHLADLVRGIDRTLRSELRLLSTSSVEERDLATALADLCVAVERESGLDVHCDVDVVELGPTARTALYHAAREALINVRKHAEATTVWLTLRRRGGKVMIRVDDDGRGVSASAGIGLKTAQERLEALGGGVTLTNTERGARFEAWVPQEDR